MQFSKSANNIVPQVRRNARLVLALLLLTPTALFAQSKRTQLWTGTATVHGQTVPIHLDLTGAGDALKGAFRNGAELSPSSSGSLQDGHLVLNFDYFARKLDATVTGDTLQGTYGTAKSSVPVTLHRATGPASTPASPAAAKLAGDWEIAVQSPKGESAWTLRVNETRSTAAPLKAVILRIDGDTGSLYGNYDPAQSQALVSHFTAAGPALYALKPQSDGTLTVTNLLKDNQQWTARRPQEARKENLAPPTASNQQTTVQDPSQPFNFSFPNLAGKTVSSSDPEFKGKVVIVAIGGSWCPNCHDEAPLLVELYKRFHNRGLEVVNLSFEEDDQLQNPTRLRAFVQRYGIPYPVLVAGTPDQLTEKVPQGKNLNCWPTSFFLGRDGLVKETHAGFSGPATGKSHEELRQETIALVEKLLSQQQTVAQR